MISCLGLKFVKLSTLPTLFTHFALHRLGELKSRYLGIKGLKHSYGTYNEKKSV